MRILAHIHTLNDEEVIEQSLGAVLNQTRPLDAILIVDNGSSDATLQRSFPENVSIIRHGENLGTNGAVHSGMRFAIDHGYEWIWIFDADSAPRPDALEMLLDFYHRLPKESQKYVHRLSSLPVDITTRDEFHGMILTARGFKHLEPPSGAQPYECTSTIWTGSLFQIAAVRDIGLPAINYVLDWGEYVYGYYGARKGYRAYVVQTSIVDHNIDKMPTSAIHARVSFGPIGFNVMEIPPVRLYYIIRNGLSFWLHEFHGRSLRQTLRVVPSWSWIPKHIIKFILLGRWKELTASLRGIRDGVLGRMDQRY